MKQQTRAVVVNTHLSLKRFSGTNYSIVLLIVGLIDRGWQICSMHQASFLVTIVAPTARTTTWRGEQSVRWTHGQCAGSTVTGKENLLARRLL